MNLSKLQNTNNDWGRNWNWISRSEYLDWRVICLISVYIMGIFSLRDLLILLDNEWPHLYGVVGVSSIRWEEIVNYLPFAKVFSFSNLFPIAPTIDQTLNGWTFFPIISIFVFQILFKLIGFGNLDIYLILSHSLLSLLNFWLIYLIFRLFIQKSWALFLAFLGVGYFSNFSSIAYFIELIRETGSFIELASIDPPEVSRIPFPAISLPFFTGTLYLTIQNNQLHYSRIISLSILWGLQIYVYAFNFIAGMLFWVFWICYAQYINDKEWNIRHIIKNFFLSLTIVSIVAAPFLIKYFFFQSEIDQQFVSRLAWFSENDVLFYSNWGFWIGYVFPVSFVIFTIYFFRADYYELFYKFTPVFIAIGVDLIMGSLHLLYGKMISPELYHNRISGIVFRFFHFIPLLYFLGVPYKIEFSKRHKWQSKLKEKVHYMLQLLVVQHRVLVCGVGIILFSGVEILGSIRYLQNHQKQVAPFMIDVQREIQIVQKENIQKGLVVYETLAANLLSPLLTSHSTLLASSYSNHVKEREILDRLTLFAKLFNWSEERFLDFMSPVPEYRSPYQGSQFVMDENQLKQGLGYWLLNSQKQISGKDLEIYKKNLRLYFQQMDLKKAIREYRIKAVLSKSPLKIFSNVTSKEGGKYFLYTFSL